MERVSFLGAQFFRAPAAHRGGRAVFPAGNKQARGASSRCWVGAQSRKSVSANRRQHMSARFTFRKSIAAMLAAPALVAAGTAYAARTGPGAPTNTATKCLAPVRIPGNALGSYATRCVQ